MKKLLMKFSDNVLSRSQMKGVRGGYGEEEESHAARCFKGNELKCTVHRPSEVCSTQQNSDEWCRSGCELEWDCTDCNG